MPVLGSGPSVLTMGWEGPGRRPAPSCILTGLRPGSHAPRVSLSTSGSPLLVHSPGAPATPWRSHCFAKGPAVFRVPRGRWPLSRGWGPATPPSQTLSLWASLGFLPEIGHHSTPTSEWLRFRDKTLFTASVCPLPGHAEASEAPCSGGRQ